MGGRKRRVYAQKPRRHEPARPATGHAFLIVVEGEATEVSYLCEVRSRLKRKPTNVVVHHGDCTDPTGVILEAIRLAEEQAAKTGASINVPYDRVWVVIDRERQNHPRREQLPKAIELAFNHGIRVALSVPAFEFWLLLHYKYTTASFDGCTAVTKILKKFIKDYNKSELPLNDLIARIPTAMKHAAQCRKHWETAGGDRNPATDVDQLMAELNDSARPDLRLF